MNNSKDDVEMSDDDEVESDNGVIKRLQKSLKRSRSSSTESNKSRSVETEEMRKSVNVETLISPFLSDESFTGSPSCTKEDIDRMAQAAKKSRRSSGGSKSMHEGSLEDKIVDDDGEIRDKFSHISSGMNEAAEKSNRENKGVADVISSNMSIVGSNSSHEGGLVDKREAGEIGDKFSHEG